MVLFGGDSLQGTRFGDTWEWDGENWTQVDDIGPGARSHAAMAYDAQRGSTVLFGGTNGTTALGDTREWNGEDWTQMADSGPSARTEHRMVFDPVRNRVLMFGGEAASGLLNDTWEWDGNEWVQVEDAGPAPRRAHALTFDTARRRAVLFGGFVGPTAVEGDTWEWDGATWTQTSDFGPPASAAGTLVFNGRRALLFGGQSGSAVFGLTWEWDGKHWTVRQDMGPGTRWNHAMVFDTTRQRGVLFGGATVLNPASASGDTWEQFEQGAVAQPPPGGGTVQLQSVAVTPAQPVEGDPLAIVATLTGTAPAGTSVAFTLTDTGGNDLFGGQVSVQADGSTTAQTPVLFLAAGTYAATATVGGSTQNVAITVATSPLGLSLQLFNVNPANATAGVPFTLNAALDNPVPGPATVTVPLRVGVQGGQDLTWGGQQQLVVQPGQVAGSLSIDPAIFGAFAGQLMWTATFGGAGISATVNIT